MTTSSKTSPSITATFSDSSAMVSKSKEVLNLLEEVCHDFKTAWGPLHGKLKHWCNRMNMEVLSQLPEAELSAAAQGFKARLVEQLHTLGKLAAGQAALQHGLDTAGPEIRKLKQDVMRWRKSDEEQSEYSDSSWLDLRDLFVEPKRGCLPRILSPRVWYLGHSICTAVLVCALAANWLLVKEMQTSPSAGLRYVLIACLVWQLLFLLRQLRVYHCFCCIDSPDRCVGRLVTFPELLLVSLLLGLKLYYDELSHLTGMELDVAFWFDYSDIIIMVPAFISMLFTCYSLRRMKTHRNLMIMMEVERLVSWVHEIVVALLPENKPKNKESSVPGLNDDSELEELRAAELPVVVAVPVAVVPPTEAMAVEVPAVPVTEALEEAPGLAPS